MAFDLFAGSSPTATATAPAQPVTAPTPQSNGGGFDLFAGSSSGPSAPNSSTPSGFPTSNPITNFNSPAIKTQSWNGQQIPASIPTKNLVAYDQATGNKTFKLPSFAGGGVYTEDAQNNLVNTGHGDYAGVGAIKGSERDDIIPVSLGGDNSNSNNIAIVPGFKGGVAASEDTAETAMAGAVKSDAIQPKAAITDILSQKAQIANTPSLWDKITSIPGDIAQGAKNVLNPIVNPPKPQSLDFPVSNLGVDQLNQKVQSQLAIPPEGNPTAMTPKNLIDTAQATPRAVAALTISGYQMFQDAGENQMNLQNSITGQPQISHTDVGHSVEPTAMSPFAQALLGTDTIKDLPGQASDLETQLNQAGITGTTAAILASLGVSASTVAALSPLGSGGILESANDAVIKLADNFTRDTGIPITRAQMTAIANNLDSSTLPEGVDQATYDAWKNYVNKAAASKLAAKSGGVTEIPSGASPETPVSTALKNAATKDIFGGQDYTPPTLNEKGFPTSNPIVKSEPTETPAETPQQQLATLNEKGFPTKSPIIQVAPKVTPNVPETVITPKVETEPQASDFFTKKDLAGAIDESKRFPDNQMETNYKQFVQKYNQQFGRNFEDAAQFTKKVPGTTSLLYSQDHSDSEVFDMFKKRMQGQAGFIAPGQMASDIKDYIAKNQAATTNAKNVGNTLYDLKQQREADRIEAAKVMTKVKEMGITKQDSEQIYHHAEDSSVALTPKQQAAYDLLKPIEEAAKETYMRIKDKTDVSGEGYVHRVVANKGGMFDKLLADTKGVASKAGLIRKSAPGLKTRVMKAIVDEQGNRQVVAIKGGKVTAFNKGVATDLGDLKQPITTKQKEFYDKAVMDKLNTLAKSLGVEHERLSKPLKGNMAGKSLTGQSKVITGFATPEDVLLHEIGHQIDEQFGLAKGFAKPNWLMDEDDVKIIKVEMRNLADARAANQNITPGYAKYLRKEGEKIAVMFQSYLHAPDLFKQIAPRAYDKFTELLKSEPKLSPILDIKPSLVLGSRKIGGNPNVAGQFVDKAGNKYQIKEATTKEIEANTDTLYHKNYVANTIQNFQDLTQSERAINALDKLLDSPDTKEIAVKVGTQNPPDGWRTTSAIRGYYFEPKTAAAIDSIMGNGDEPGALTKVNLMLRDLVVLNPYFHGLNIASQAFVNRGLVGTLANIPTELKAGMRAISDVYNKNDNYIALMRSGAPIGLFGKGTQDYYEGMLNALQDEVAKSSGDKTVDFFKKIGSIPTTLKNSTSFLQDVLSLQRIYEMQAQGKSLLEAITELSKDMPNYRLPANAVGNFLRSPNVALFGTYEFGLAKSLGEMGKDLGKSAVGQGGKGGAKESVKTGLHTLDKIAALVAVIYLVQKGEDKLIQKLTGNPNAHTNIPGVAGLVMHIVDLARGTETPESFLLSRTAIGSKELVQQGINRDFFTGNQITPYNLTNEQSWKDRINHVIENLPQVGTEVQQGWKPFVQGLFGIYTPKNSPETTAFLNLVYSKQSLSSEVKKAIIKGDDSQAYQIIETYNSALNEAGKTAGQSAKTLKADEMKYPQSKTIQGWKKGK